MMDQKLCLTELAPGQRARVRAVTAREAMRRRLLDLGLIEDTTVECVGRSPGGDPKAYLIRGAVIALRARDSDTVLVERL